MSIGDDMANNKNKNQEELVLSILKKNQSLMKVLDLHRHLTDSGLLHRRWIHLSDYLERFGSSGFKLWDQRYRCDIL